MCRNASLCNSIDDNTINRICWRADFYDTFTRPIRTSNHKNNVIFELNLIKYSRLSRYKIIINFLMATKRYIPYLNIPRFSKRYRTADLETWILFPISNKIWSNSYSLNSVWLFKDLSCNTFFKIQYYFLYCLRFIIARYQNCYFG